MLPAELAQAARPLRRAGRALEDVADSRRGLVELLAASPSPRLVEAFRHYLAAWELVVWSAAHDAEDLAARVEDAAYSYAEREASLAGRIPVLAPNPYQAPHQAHAGTSAQAAPSPHPAAQPAPGPVR